MFLSSWDSCSGENLDYTPAHNKDFGVLDYDCRFEGLFAYMIYIFTQLWGFVWLYDLRYLMLNPSVNTIQYMIYYKIFVYFIGFLISIVIFFPNQHLYTEVRVNFAPLKFTRDLFVDSHLCVLYQTRSRVQRFR